MAMPVSGSLSICVAAGAPQTCRSIRWAVGVDSGSLSTLSACAGKSAPHCMREFYGYNPVSYSISLATNQSEIFDGQIDFNTITASAAWSASKADPNSIISSFTASGAGSGKISVAGTFAMPPFPAQATITYCITASPSTNTTWLLCWCGY